MFNDLLEALEAAGFQVFAYADDLAIVGQGKNKIEVAIKIVEEWTRKNKMKINKKKSGIMIFKKKRRKNAENEEKEITGYPIVEEYKYLGIWLDSRMSFKR